MQQHRHVFESSHSVENEQFDILNYALSATHGAKSLLLDIPSQLTRVFASIHRLNLQFKRFLFHFARAFGSSSVIQLLLQHYRFPVGRQPLSFCLLLL